MKKIIISMMLAVMVSTGAFAMGPGHDSMAVAGMVELQ